MTIRAEFASPPAAAAAPAPAAAPQNASGGTGGVDKLVPEWKVKLNGQPLPAALRECLYTVEVQQSLTLVSMAILVFDNPGSIVSDAPEVGGGVEVEVELGYLGELKPVFKGEVISIEPNFPQGGNPFVLIRAYDKLHRMRRGTKQRTFLEQKVSDIVKSIASEEGLSPDIEDTQVKAPYILQNNQSNVDFLHELAKRYHCEITVDGPNKKLKLKRPSTTGQQSKSLKWGETLKSFYVKMSLANVPTKVEVKSWDAKTKKIVTQSAEQSHGAMDTKPSIIDLAKKTFGEAKKTVSIRPSCDPKEAKAMAESALNDAAMDSVKGTATCMGDNEITPGMIILLEGLGATWTGQYYVTGATHLLHRASGYTTSIDVKRPGTGNTPVQQQVDPVPPAEEEEEAEEEEKPAELATGVKHGEGPADGGTPAADQDDDEPEEEEAEEAPEDEGEPAPDTQEGEAVADSGEAPEEASAPAGEGGGAAGDDVDGEAEPLADTPVAEVVKTLNCYLVAAVDDEALAAYDDASDRIHGHASWSVKNGDTGTDTKEEVRKKLQAWMDSVAKAQTGGEASTASVSWSSAPAANSTTATTDLYVYVTTIEKSKFGKDAAKKVHEKDGVNGQTLLKAGNKVLCEVWVGSIANNAGIDKFITRLSQLIFHEWMHFKTDIDAGAGDIVHGLGGLGTVPIGEDSVYNPTPGNISKVAEGLAKKYKFF